MFSGRITHATLKVLDFIARTYSSTDEPLQDTREPAAGAKRTPIFTYGDLGYVIIARNFRSPRGRGEIDLIGWHKDVLCFIEVKTRTSHDVKPAEAAVDRDKWRQLSATAREYLRHLPHDLQWRFDVISVYYDRHSSPPQFQLFQNALPAS